MLTKLLTSLGSSSLLFLSNQKNDSAPLNLSNQDNNMTEPPPSRRRKMVKAILFDMDGTLLDTETLSDKAVLNAFGTSLPSDVRQQPQSPMSRNRLPWEIKKPTLGLRGNDWIPLVIDYAQKHWGVTETNAPTVSDFWKIWEQGLNDMCHEIGDCPGATELVEELAKTGIPMAIATSSQYNAVEKKRIRHDRIFKHIKVIVAGDDPSIKNGKPAPDIYIEAAKRLNVDLKDCLVFEDALSGVISGKAAGCQVVAIPDSRFSSDELQTYRDEGSDLVLRTLWDFDGREFGINVNMVEASAATRKS